MTKKPLKNDNSKQDNKKLTPNSKVTLTKTTKTSPLEEKTVSQNDPVTVKQFTNTYKTISLVISILILFTLVNFILIFVVAWMIGNQLSVNTQNSLGSRLVSLEEKTDAIIEALPEQIRPKLNLKVVAPDKEVDRWSGNKDNRYVLIKYSDLECPYCQAVQPEVEKFVEKNSKEVSLIFRNLPLTNIHPNAQRLAETAECVAEINGESAFWSFVNGVYDGTIAVEVEGEEMLGEYVEKASEVNLCVSSGKSASKVDRDVQDAIDATVTGTPTFILYDTQKSQSKFVQNPGSADGLQQIFDAFKAKQEK